MEEKTNKKNFFFFEFFFKIKKKLKTQHQNNKKRPQILEKMTGIMGLTTTTGVKSNEKENQISDI